MPVQVFCRYFITQWNTLLFVKAVNSELSVTVRDKEGVRVTNKIRFDHRDYFEPSGTVILETRMQESGLRWWYPSEVRFATQLE